MKKIILLLLVLLVYSFGYSQEFGKYKIENAITYNNNTLFATNKWYKNKEGSFCLKKYNQTPIGIKNAISDTKSILYSNDVKFSDPFIDDSFLSSIVTGIEDYEMLNITIKQESSVVSKQWRIPGSIYVALNLKNEKYEITVFKL
jgi:hypothetical protein